MHAVCQPSIKKLLTYLLYNEHLFSVCDVTGARWRLYANHNSFHGVVPSKPVGSQWLTLWSLDECLQVCAGDLRCQAADFDTDSRTCYVHRHHDFTRTRGPYPRVNQFVASVRCQPGNTRVYITCFCLNPLTPSFAIRVQLAIRHLVPERVKPSFVIFDIRALRRSGLSVRVPGCQKLQMTA